MQVYPNRIESIITKGLAPFYLVFGDEPQQRFETIELIRSTGKNQGYDERLNWITDNQFEWDLLLEASQSMSLFSSRKMIELELPTGKPGAAGSKALIKCAEQTNPDVTFILHGPKIGRDVQNSKWFKTLDKLGVYVPCLPLESKTLKQWISNRCQSAQLQIDTAKVDFLADYSEGNMLAAAQEIEKLSLLYGTAPFSLEQLQQSLANHSRFNVFQLVDSLLSGDSDKALKILLRLESEGIEPNVIWWALNKESQTLNQLAMFIKSGQPLHAVFKQLNIWQSRQSLYQLALSRLNQSALHALGSAMAKCDILLKSNHAVKPYVMLSHLCLLYMPHDLSRFPLEFE
jgi:DNA polymerase-3 subunit delta